MKEVTQGILLYHDRSFFSIRRRKYLFGRSGIAFALARCYLGLTTFSSEGRRNQNFSLLSNPRRGWVIRPREEICMAEMNSGSSSGITRLILIPSVITLLVTILRLIGELQHWSSVWFHPGAGGGGAIIGITWLVPIFGVYFALKLSGAGEGLERAGRAILLAVLGLLAMAGGTFIAFAPQIQFPGKVVAGLLLVAAAAALQLPAWPALFCTLLAYGY